MLPGRLLFPRLACTRALASAAAMPKCDFEFEGYEGMPYGDSQKIHTKNLAPTSIPYYSKPLLASQGRMQWIWDEEGRRYLDLFAGIVTVSVGHCHPKVVAAAQKQMSKLWHTTSIYMTSPVYQYAEKLTATLPGDLKVCFLVNSGTEANDLAMTLARVHTGAFDIISLRHGYHGAGPYAIGLTAHAPWKHQFANGFGIHHAMNPDPYRGLWGGARCKDSPVQVERSCSCAVGECEAASQYAGQLEEILNHSVPKKVAAFFAESMQGISGATQFPKGYLQKAYNLIRSRGGLCVADEVQTGFGRIGSHMWGFQSHGVMPDIVTMAKGIANGFPMAAVVTTPEIAASFTGANYFNTFAGNPLACAIASSVLDVIKEEKTQENAEKVGTYFLEELGKLRSRYDVIGDVRGKGLMIGVELVTDKESKTHLPVPQFVQILDDLKELGVLVGRGGLRSNVMRIKPPMCITKDDVDFALGALVQAFNAHEARSQ